MAKLEAEMAEVTERMSSIRERLPQADAEYRERLTRWHGEDSKGARPESPLPALENELRALEEDHGALESLVAEALAEKVAWIEDNRSALVRDAERDSKEKRAAYADAADRLVEAREEFIVARRDEIYFQLFPDASLASEPPAAMLAGGILARLRTAVSGLSVPFGMAELRRLLETDAEFVSSMMTGDQRQALRAREPDPAPSPGDAVWTGTPEGQEQIKRERREARERAFNEWGVWPDW